MMALSAVAASGAVRSGDHVVGVAAILLAVAAACWDAWPAIARHFPPCIGRRNKDRRALRGHQLAPPSARGRT